MNRTWAQLLVLVAVVAIGVGHSGMAVAKDPASSSIEPVAEGEIRINEKGLLEERVVLPDFVVDELLKVQDNSAIRFVGWPIAPGDHRTVVLRPFKVYGANTRIFEVRSDGMRQVPHSPRKYFIGEIEGEPGSGALVIFDPRTGQVNGLAMSNGESYDMVPVKGGRNREVSVVSTRERVDEFDPSWECGEEEVGEAIDLPLKRPSEKNAAVVKSSAQLEAVLAIDTDTELLSLKFGNNTGAAADYVADLIAAMNVMYSRDLGLTLVQGTTYLRTGSDPYSANSGSSASGPELTEFGNYWKANYGGVSRSLAAMLSGKSPSQNSASGIAWVGGLCSSSYGYSFSKVFRMNYLSGDAKLVGHEIGHNFGSPHTHCYSPAVDHCISQGGSCYDGPTSCPSGGPGTVMSYCHLVGCGSTLDFHPTVISNILNNHVNPATGVCIFEATATNSIFTDGFEDGDTNEWE